jgi:hypothetical protein
LLLDTNTPQPSATGSALSLGTQLAGPPPLPPVPLLLDDEPEVELAVLPVGQLSANVQSSS